jgi:hypothetical protein
MFILLEPGLAYLAAIRLYYLGSTTDFYVLAVILDQVCFDLVVLITHQVRVVVR